MFDAKQILGSIFINRVSYDYDYMYLGKQDDAY